jgi:hypothetical protein
MNILSLNNNTSKITTAFRRLSVVRNVLLAQLEVLYIMNPLTIIPVMVKNLIIKLKMPF